MIVPAIACDFILYVLTTKSTQAHKWEATLQLLLMSILIIIWLCVIGTLLDFFFDVRPSMAEVTWSVLVWLFALITDHGSEKSAVVQHQVLQLHIVLDDSMVSSVVCLCQSTLAFTTALVVMVKCCCEVLLCKPILTCIIVITIDGLLLVL